MDAFAESASLQHLVEFVTQAFGGCQTHFVMLFQNSSPCCLVKRKTLLMLETDTTQHAYRILPVNLVGFCWGAQQFLPDVGSPSVGRIDNLSRGEILVEGIAGVVAAHGVLFKAAETCLEERNAILGIRLDMWLHAFHQGEAAIDDDIHGGRAVALVIEWSLAGLGEGGAHVFHKLALTIGEIDEQVQIRIAFAEEFVTNAASDEIDLTIERGIFCNLAADKAQGLFELVHGYNFDDSRRR